MKALKEVVKFALRLTVLGLPVIINALTDAGYTEVAGVASAVLILLDKYIHVSPANYNGLLPF